MMKAKKKSLKEKPKESKSTHPKRKLSRKKSAAHKKGEQEPRSRDVQSPPEMKFGEAKKVVKQVK